MSKKILILLLSVLFIITACSPSPTPTDDPGPVTLTVMTHDSFAVSEEVVKAFEIEYGAKLVFLKSGDTAYSNYFPFLHDP